MYRENNDPAIGAEVGISYFAVTGMGERICNEDYYGHACYENTVTFVVSDGVGGQAGGSMASEIVVEMIRRQARSLNRDEMLRSYQAIEQEIRNRQQHRPEYERMGATVAELRIDPARQMAIWGHFGDSRIYWIRNGEILTITHDHSVVKSLVAAGLITESAALAHPKKNVLMGAFGVAGDVMPEVLETPVYIADGDAFLLCTDGFWNCVPDHVILELLNISKDVMEWIQKLELQAQASMVRNKDNYTAIGIWITPDAERTVRMDLP